MKKTLLTILIFAFTISISLAQVEITGSFLDWQATEINFEEYDVDSQSWSTDIQIKFNYDNSNKITDIRYLGEEDGSSNLVEYFRSIYAYNGQNRVSEITGEAIDKDSGTWMVAQKTLNTYASGNLVEVLNQINNEGTWLNIDKTEYDYNADGLISEERYYYFNFITLMLTPETKYEYTYDDGVLVGVLESEYAMTIQDYEVKYRQTNIRSGNNSTILSEEWVGGAWQNDYRDIRTFDGNNYPVMTLSENWDSGTSSWMNDYRETSTYGAVSYPDVILTEDWINGAWQLSDRITFTYHDNLGVDHNNLSEIKIYPNPFSETIQVSNMTNGTIENIQVFDQLGRRVFVSERNQNSYNLTQLSAGSYLVNLKTTDGVVSKKLIKN
ncbi:MAG: T9SS type A sorting domain-containing protein [Leeuwenhoekiella sp.]